MNFHEKFGFLSIALGIMCLNAKAMEISDHTPNKQAFDIFINKQITLLKKQKENVQNAQRITLLEKIKDNNLFFRPHEKAFSRLLEIKYSIDLNALILDDSNNNFFHYVAEFQSQKTFIEALGAYEHDIDMHRLNKDGKSPFEVFYDKVARNKY